MSLISVTCERCGRSAQIEAGLRAVCPYCGSALHVPAPDSGFAYAQDVQFAPPPVQQAEQVQPVQRAENAKQDNPAAYMYPPFSEPKPVRQYPPEQLAEASRKRGFWYAKNIAVLLLQTLMLSFGIVTADYFYRERLGTLVILEWLVSVPLWAVISARIRPDEAYLNRTPLLISKKAQAVMHALLSVPAAALLSGMFCTALEILRIMF